MFLTIPNLSKSALAQRPAPCVALFHECLVRAPGSTPEVRLLTSQGEMFSGLGTLGQLKGEEQEEGWVPAEVYLKRYISQRHLSFNRWLSVPEKCTGFQRISLREDLDTMTVRGGEAFVAGAARTSDTRRWPWL